MPSARGLYESLITEALEVELATLDPRLVVHRLPLHEAEAADRLALHLGRVVARALSSLKKQNRLQVGIALARQLSASSAGHCTRISRLTPSVEYSALRRPAGPSISSRCPDVSSLRVNTYVIGARSLDSGHAAPQSYQGT